MNEKWFTKNPSLKYRAIFATIAGGKKKRNNGGF
jgi:hypothetical protein